MLSGVGVYSCTRPEHPLEFVNADHDRPMLTNMQRQRVFILLVVYAGLELNSAPLYREYQPLCFNLDFDRDSNYG